MFTLIALLFLPVTLPVLARMKWPHKICWKEMSVILGVTSFITVSVYAIGAYSQSYDTELLSGQVTSKARTHGSYTRTYDCHCTYSTDSKGNQTKRCQTCREKHYTVDWDCYTTLGEYSIESADRTSRSVYSSPDPARFTLIKNGDPVAKEHTYTNWIKAAPDSLFNTTANDFEKFKDLIPFYPRVYDFYNVNRIIPVGVSVPNVSEWNLKLANSLRTLGPARQVNVLIVLVGVDQSYYEALRAAWLGGKKNDLIVIIGAKSYPEMNWVSILSWSDSQLLKVRLRDDIMAMKSVDQDAIIKLIETNVSKDFIRKPMADFEYLKDGIDPPTWAIILALVLSLTAGGFLTYYFYNNRMF